MQNWVYDEHRHCGVNYSDEDTAEDYDRRHQAFRDYEREFNGMIEFLDLKDLHELSVMDLGCGTGAVSIYAAERFKKVRGIDVSEVMIQQARKKMPDTAHSHVEFILGGFLSYRHEDEPVDVLMTKAALHHLPDFWKQVALLKMNTMLKPEGILYIHDVVFHFEAAQYNDKISRWISAFEKKAGEKFRDEVETHIREEYSTFKWILDGMLERAGFRIEKCRTDDGFVTEYHCMKMRPVGEEVFGKFPDKI